jgi:formamidopyrimidine-DNA glycosylase
VPELPEVETTLRGVSPYCNGHVVSQVIIKRRDLRWPIPDGIETLLIGQPCIDTCRRGKYILLIFPAGSVLIHLGMSGSLRVVQANQSWKKHDHVEIFFGEFGIRLHDPRRFGCVLWAENWRAHPLIKSLGVEPLSDDFSVEYLKKKFEKRSVAIKVAIMDAKVVTGVGNIYAAEALFLAEIHPRTPACELGAAAISKLIKAIQQVLNMAIDMGGTTLRDFVSQDGQPGYFKQRLNVYARAHLPCVRCQKPLFGEVMAGRQTVYCIKCQKMSLPRD